MIYKSTKSTPMFKICKLELLGSCPKNAENLLVDVKQLRKSPRIFQT